MLRPVAVVDACGDYVGYSTVATCVTGGNYCPPVGYPTMGVSIDRGRFWSDRWAISVRYYQ
jgi:hypothetical protein